jgi:hypothetical protein
MTTHYNSKSKGPTPIATMPYNHLVNARDILASKAEEARKPELDALNARIAEINAMAAEEAEL